MLSATERKHLKARAHKLEPVVVIGTQGLTDEVVKEVDGALKALCERTGAESVQSIGKVFVIYRQRDE